MASKKRHNGSTPPSERPERAGSAELAERELPVWPEQVVGAKPIRSLERILDQLHGPNAHGNRVLFLDDVLVAYLLAQGRRTLKFCSLKDFRQEGFVSAAATAVRGETVTTGMLFRH